MKSIAIIFSLVSIIWSAEVFSADAQRGQKLYSTCIQCHGDKGLGNVDKEAPRISGQFDWYILASLKAFKSGERKNAAMMPYIAKLGNKDFEDLAAYVSTLK